MQIGDDFVFALWNLRVRRKSGYEGAKAASLASREFIEESPVLKGHVPLLCHNRLLTVPEPKKVW